MALRKEVARMRRRAEEVRESRDYTADNVAVQAAARYCLRTGKDWRVGYGGRCELGKRALKQWGYELVGMHVKRAWQSGIGRTLMIVLPILAILALMVAIGWGPLVLAVAILAVFIGLGVIYGIGVVAATKVAKVTLLMGYLRELVAEAEGFLKAFLFVAATLGFPLVLVAYGLYRFARRYGKYVGNAFIALLVLAFAGLIVLAFITAPFVSLMVTIGIFLMLALMAGVTFAWMKLSELRKRRAKSVKASADVARVRQRLEPTLRKAYESYLSGFDHGMVSFDDWVNALENALAAYDYTWFDLARTRAKVDDLSDILHKCNNVSLMNLPVELLGSNPILNAYEFAKLLWEANHPNDVLPSRRKELRRQRRAEVFATLIDLWYSFKLGVCPTVNLPALEQVTGTMDTSNQPDEDNL